MSDQQSYTPSESPGRNKALDIDSDATLQAVREVASLPITEEQMAAALNISEATWYRYKAQSERFCEAIKDGKAQCVTEVAGEFKRRALEGKSKMADAILMMWAKQRPTRGGLGMMDERSLHVQGEIRHALTPAQQAWQQRLSEERGEAVEADYKEIEAKPEPPEDAR